jgi:UbiD family decarboxylase
MAKMIEATQTSLRAYLAYLRQDDRLLEIEREVDPRFEIAAVIQALDFGTYPVLFNNVKGCSHPVVAGTNGSRLRFAEMLNTDLPGIVPRIIAALDTPMPYRYVSASESPTKARRIGAHVDIPSTFPVPTFHLGDDGPYITAGVLVARDDETGRLHTSIRRHHVIGGNRINVLIGSPRLLTQLARYEARDEGMPVAVVLGLHPLVMLASQMAFEVFPQDKFEVASALLDQPLDMVSCDTIDLAVPAHAEIVMEGHIVPNLRLPEGPFGELGKYYGGRKPWTVMEISAVTMRADWIFQVILP